MQPSSVPLFSAYQRLPPSFPVFPCEYRILFRFLSCVICRFGFMVLFPCAVICRNLLILSTRLLSFSLRKWALFRHFSHMRVHCTYQNGSLSLSLSLPLSRMDGPFVSLTIFEPTSQITFPVTSMKHRRGQWPPRFRNKYGWRCGVSRRIGRRLSAPHTEVRDAGSGLVACTLGRHAPSNRGRIFSGGGGSCGRWAQAPG